MMVVGIDPAPERSGVVLFRGAFGVFRIEACILTNREVRASLRHWRHAADLIAIERMQGMGMPVGKEVFETCEWIGRFVEICSAHETKIRYLYRTQVKAALCGSASAKSANVRAALIERLGAPGTKKTPGVTYGVTADAWSALAVAVVAFDKEMEKCYTSDNLKL